MNRTAVSPLPDWLERHTSTAPPVLRERVLRHVDGGSAGEDPADRMARAGRHALASALRREQPRREVALDLLAADALVTLALLWRAEHNPETVARFAGDILSTGIEPQ
ncbi:MAG: hypothetical protein ACREL6_05895 [Gemmatimonadales bacterium]